jgi:hypothetical protein
MGIFKQMKDMKDMVGAAPEMVAQARLLGAQAQEMAAAQQAAQQLAQQSAFQAQQSAAGQAYQGSFAQDALDGQLQDGPQYGTLYEPIAGVSLEQYARVSKGVAAYNYDQAKLPVVAASFGIAEVDWDDAYRGWNDRIKANPAVAKQFNTLYRSV